MIEHALSKIVRIATSSVPQVLAAGRKVAFRRDVQSCAAQLAVAADDKDLGALRAAAAAAAALDMVAGKPHWKTVDGAEAALAAAVAVLAEEEKVRIGGLLLAIRL